ncbi:MAG TPA: UDP binding domain-containing protein, partial [Baekduia sp.]|nr:UDP binding domain-containing protein [Baekduia sp.]
PRFLLAGDADARLPLAAREINERMPAYAADLLGDVDGRRVLILGVAYRGGVKETAFSGAFALRDALEGRGATVVASDPLFDDDELRGHGFAPWDGEGVDAAVVQADHREYATLTAADLPGVGVIVDGRGILDASRFDGVPVRRIGRPEGVAADPGSAIAPRS